MYNFTPVLQYKANGHVINNSSYQNDDYSLNISVTDNEVKVVLLPKKEIELISFKMASKRPMEQDEVFFINGFQSWSTSYEVHRGEKIKGVTPLSKISKFTHHLATMFGDYEIFDDYDTEGRFHSNTYTYFRKENKIELFGSMNEKTGYTFFAVNNNDDSFDIVKDVDGVYADAEYELLNVKIVKGSYDDAFDEYFSSMNLRKSHIDHLSGYTSWYNYFQKIDENIIIRDLNGLDKVKDSVSIFQIDDGFESAVGDWLIPDSKKFPKGMKYIADEVHKKGYLAGVWLAPFSAQRNSKVVKEHPDWLIKDSSGKPEWGCISWGGAYTLDIYNPEAREYIKHFFHVILREWGYDMVKLDFLYSQSIHPRNGKSRGQIMCEGLEFLRECVGDDKLFLGCGVPLGATFGVVDACRISCDVDLNYNGKIYNTLNITREVPSAQNAINNSIFRRHLNGRVFCNDPDVFFLRDNNLKFTPEQKYLLGKINNLFGDVLFVSDNAGDYGEKEIDLVTEFFKENKAKILSAYRKDKDIIEIKYMENNETKQLVFNISTGKILK